MKQQNEPTSTDFVRFLSPLFISSGCQTVNRQDVYRRQELYEQVWSQPVAKIAPSYGISVALAKICRKLKVPLPGRGYWLNALTGTRLRPRLLEMGTSGGLNLRCDRYRYEWPGGTWGNPLSPVRLESVFIDGAPFLTPVIRIIDRAGCDPSPVDITSDSGRLTLLSYTWADQVDRIRRLAAAI